MNIYYIWQGQNTDYDTYDSAVVVAESEQQAKMLHPSETTCEMGWYLRRLPSAYDSWTTYDNVGCALVGRAIGDKMEVVCASFNAG